MSRYVSHSYGLVIGSDNIWFLTSSDGEFRQHYRSVVITNFYEHRDPELGRYSMGLDTPAQRLLWYVNDIEGDNWGDYYLNPAMAHWLNENIGPKFDKWDAMKFSRHNHANVFFRGRNDAVKFVRFVKQVLGNVKYSK